ncbi:YkvA family protein [Parahaliea mediterranea]|uniref:YkvA family protein n=1 Tax=Parahaliea mediterranea TaxID=651086 RepID=UPI000E2FA0FC|nr:YkvA family protein [Parahaliea mediterranea]
MAKRSAANTKYYRAYSEEGFWHKVRRFSLTAGRELTEKSLMLYYAARRPQTPTWAKATIYGALGYFIAPLDAIVDITPGIGYSDDLGVLALAFVTVARYIDDEVRSRARRKVDRLFGAAVLPPERQS